MEQSCITCCKPAMVWSCVSNFTLKRNQLAITGEASDQSKQRSEALRSTSREKCHCWSYNKTKALDKFQKKISKKPNNNDSLLHKNPKLCAGHRWLLLTNCSVKQHLRYTVLRTQEPTRHNNSCSCGTWRGLSFSRASASLMSAPAASNA